MCVTARQPPAVTLPPGVRFEEVQLNAVTTTTRRRFTSNYDVESNLFKVYITLMCHNVQTLGAVKKTKRDVKEITDDKSCQGRVNKNKTGSGD